MIDLFAEYAVIRANIFLIIACFIAIVFLFVSVNTIFFKKKIYTVPVIASIKSSNCVQTDPKQIMFDCNLEVTYSVEGQVFNANLTKRQNTKLNVGDKIELYHEKGAPINVSVNPDNNNVAYGLLIFGVLLVGGAYLSLYFTKKYKGFATISGGVQAVGDVTSILRG